MSKIQMRSTVTKTPPNRSKDTFKVLDAYSINKLILLGFLFMALLPNAMAQSPIKVNAVKPESVVKNQTIELPGTVEARQHAQLASLESGRVIKLGAEVGDLVSQGDVLLSLESKLAELEVAGAAAEVKAAELNQQEAQRLYDEAQKLAVQKVVARTLIAERAALLANAEAQLARVKASHSLQRERLNRHKLKAPFDGVIATRNVDVGEWLTPQNTVFTLVAQDDLRLSVQIPQQYYKQLRNTSDVLVSIIPDTTGMTSFEARLSRMVPVSDIQTRTFAAQIDLPDSETSGLVTGMSAVAEISFPDSEKAAVIIPKAAIKQHPDGNSSVFVVKNNRAHRIITDFTDMSNGKVAIYGQAAGQTYIVSGIEVLKDGAPVEVNLVNGNQP